ncbi:MAG: CoA-binding protein [Candidatus Gracilibacteria bacterium]|nr:CoA-binding protein [Candidatus Gracilibacteria bacterium]
MKIVLVGASKNEDKFGNIIMKDLLYRGHTVIPVNPKENEIEGIKAYKDLGEIKEDFDIINIVTPPKVTLNILKQANMLGYKKVWCQPGSSNREVKDYLVKNGFDYIADACIMM